MTTVAVACSTEASYTVGGTVSGLVGSGLTLAICTSTTSHRGHLLLHCQSELQVSVNGAFTLGSAYPAGYSGGDRRHFPAAFFTYADCVISNAAISIQNANDTSVTVSCRDMPMSPMPRTIRSRPIALTRPPARSQSSAHRLPRAPPLTQLSVSIVREGKRYVFVGNEGSNDVSAFAVDNTTGALTAVPGSPFPAGTDPQAMALNAYSLRCECRL